MIIFVDCEIMLVVALFIIQQRPGMYCSPLPGLIFNWCFFYITSRVTFDFKSLDGTLFHLIEMSNVFLTKLMLQRNLECISHTTL